VQGAATLQSVYPVLKNNEIFLSTYGKALNKVGHYAEAINVLQRANLFFPCSSNYIELGKSFEGLEKYDLAEDAWQMASLMVPNRFTPGYLTVNMLCSTERTDEGREIARELINKEVKVWSPKLQKILDELKVIANQNETIKSQ
jgi:tetratricopeptide (TPR) repeat protein